MSCWSCCYYYSLELSQTSPTGDTCSQRTALEMGRPRWRESWYSSGCWRNAWSVRILIANFILRPVNPSAESVGMENVIISFILKKSPGRLLYNCKPFFKLFIYLKNTKLEVQSLFTLNLFCHCDFRCCCFGFAMLSSVFVSALSLFYF